MLSRFSVTAPTPLILSCNSVLTEDLKNKSHTLYCCYEDGYKNAEGVHTYEDDHELALGHDHKHCHLHEHECYHHHYKHIKYTSWPIVFWS